MFDEDWTDVPDEKVGQYWQYDFKHPTHEGAVAIFYGHSYEEALAKYEDTFKVTTPAVLLSRRPW